MNSDNNFEEDPNDNSCKFNNFINQQEKTSSRSNSEDEFNSNILISEERKENDFGLPCAFCNGFYGPTTTGPVCSICHMFIFEYNNISIKEYIKDKDASDDSGNEDPEEKNIQTAHDSSHSSITGNYISELKSVRQCSSSRYRQNSTSFLQIPAGGSGCYTFERLPTEVLLKIFQQLDDVSLWSVRFLARRFKAIIDLNVPDEQWRHYIEYRWPLYTSSNGTVQNSSSCCYRDIYSNMIQSVNCRTCWERMRDVDRFVSEGRWLSRRLQMESDILSKEQPYGISARCLDPKTLSAWMASIVGPPGSEYEGGLFYLLIKVPSSYPMRPPTVQFLTRIYHPNISKHGDIGIDLLHNNWSLALTISKLLISIQSLLTDPNGRICMEPEIGTMYNTNRAQFRRLSRLWTWKFAMHDYLPAQLVESIQL